MTATTVNGLEVIADEPTEAPLRGRDGKPLLWQQTRTLLLSDGTVVYGCAHCDYTRDNPNAIRPHLNRHRRRPADELSLAELLAKVGELDQITAERDQWKSRALAAEKRWRTLRTALNGNA